MSQLETIVAGFKSQIGEGIEPALKFLEQHLNPESPRFDDFIQIKSRYNSLQRELLLGTIDQNTYNQWRNSLSQALLLFSGELTEDDLRADVKEDDPREDKRGDILYYIPDRMLLNREEKCAVRLAWMQETILRDWTAREEDVRKEIRMADIMAVELLNLDERNPFQIRALSEAVQFVDNDDYTEWVFYVKPLMEGEFALVLRVSVIEIIREKEYRKDIVLEERVQVQTQEMPQQVPSSFKPAHASLTLGNAAPESRSNTSPSAAAAAPSARQAGSDQPTAKAQQSVVKTAGQSVIRQVIIGLAASVSLIITFTLGLSYYQEAQAWKKARQCGRPPCAKAYLEQYPDGRYKDEAFILLSDTILLKKDSIAVMPLTEPPAVDSTPAVDKDGLVIFPEDTVAFSLEAWEKMQTRASRKPKPRPDAKSSAAPETESNDTDLPGQVVKLNVQEFPIFQSDTGLLNFRFLKFNTNKEGFAVLHNLNGNLFRPGQHIEFVTSGGKVHRSSVQYVAVDPYRGNVPRNSRAYFRLDVGTVEAFATKKVTQIRVVNPVTQITDIYPTTRKTQQELNRRTKAALEEVKKI
ncbi:MAG: hypothetical protein L6Q97_12765 [Thermoanaerobaculia bacterium]|nr:hypothetical protein [Thermoanaerobaculia bacterium]